MKNIWFFFFSFFFLQIHAQERTSDKPLSLLSPKKNAFNSVFLPALDLKKIYKEDQMQKDLHQQANVARLQALKIKFQDSLKWAFVDREHLIFKLKIEVPKAEYLGLKIKTINLPKGTKLFLYSEHEEHTFLVFDAEKERFTKGYFNSQTVQGSNIIIEYNQPIRTVENPIIEIEGLVNFYPKAERSNPGFGQSTDCEVNVACSEGDEWCKPIHSVVRILIQSGSQYSYCSGALVNNTNKDYTPYILTAEHCGAYASDEDFKYWAFDFDYQSDHCNSPSSESEIVSHQIIGCEQIAKAARIGSIGSDFRLVKLLDSIPKFWNSYFLGWNIADNTTINGGGVGVHHPYGDIKKISTYTETLVSTDANGTTSNTDYWQVVWDNTINGHGITEGGSSGSPLIDKDGYLIGTLSTGSSYCDNMNEDSPDFYGKISRHWISNGVDSASQLRPWLNPLNLDVTKFDGLLLNEDIQCDKISNEKKFDVLPNPANQSIRIRDDLYDWNQGEIEIFDIKGRLIFSEVFQNSINGKKIDVSELSQGFYILRINHYSTQIQQKFIILR